MTSIQDQINLNPAWEPADPAERKARWEADRAEHAANYPVIAPDDIKPGDLATHYVGSDSYACMVVEVERFKSGKRKGQIKAISTVNVDLDDDGTVIPRPHSQSIIVDFSEDADGNPVPVFMPKFDRFLPTEVETTESYWSDETGWPERRKTTEIRFYGRCNGRIAYWSSLRVGYAHEHRDPHF